MYHGWNPLAILVIPVTANVLPLIVMFFVHLFGCGLSSKSTVMVMSVHLTTPGADPGFLERGYICMKVWGFALLIFAHFS